MHSISISIPIPVRSICINTASTTSGKGDTRTLRCSFNNNKNNNNNTGDTTLRMTQPQQSLRRLGGFCSQITQHSSPIVFPEKRGKKSKASSRTDDPPPTPPPTQFDKPKIDEHRIDIPVGGGGDEKSDLLGYIVYTGKLILDKRSKISTDVHQQSTSTQPSNQEAVDAKFTSKALVWGSHVLPLNDVVSVSYNNGLRHFTVHSYPVKRGSCGLSCFIKPRRTRKDYRFLASSPEEAIQWVGGFADQQCFINFLPHPLVSSKKQASSELFPTDTPPELIFRCKSPPKMLVILNPRSGRGRSSKVFHGIVEPIFKLAGFKLEVVKTTSAGHAKSLASTVDISTCPDGIICVGGDGIINEIRRGGPAIHITKCLDRGKILT